MSDEKRLKELNDRVRDIAASKGFDSHDEGVVVAEAQRIINEAIYGQNERSGHGHATDWAVAAMERCVELERLVDSLRRAITYLNRPDPGYVQVNFTSYPVPQKPARDAE